MKQKEPFTNMFLEAYVDTQHPLTFTYNKPRFNKKRNQGKQVTSQSTLVDNKGTYFDLHMFKRARKPILGQGLEHRAIVTAMTWLHWWQQVGCLAPLLNTKPKHEGGMLWVEIRSLA
jgi:hypothetical protein